MMDIDQVEINIAVFGPTSVGKSTLVNAIVKNKLSLTSSIKTTILPQIYCDKNSDFFPEKINKSNENKTQKYLNSRDLLKSSYFEPIFHNIKNIYKFFDEEFCDQDNRLIKLNIWDMPGFDNTSDCDIFKSWLLKNVESFDIVIYMTDVNIGLNELSFFDFFKESVSVNNFKMICLLNKCDEMFFDSEIGKLAFDNSDHRNVYVKINNLIAQFIENQEIEEHKITPFIPVSLNKFSDNCHDYQYSDEIDNIKTIIQNIILSNKCFFISKHITRCLENNKIKTIQDITKCLRIIHKFEVNNFIEDNINILFWKRVKEIIIQHENYIIRKCIMLCEKKIIFEDFDRIHTEIQEYLTFFVSVTNIDQFENYPADLIKYHKTKLTSNLLNIYDELSRLEYKGQVFLCPSSLLIFLEIIKTHIPEEFDEYAIKFIMIHNDVRFFTESYEKNLLFMIQYISKNISAEKCINYYLSPVCEILTNRQYYMKNKQPENYFIYLMQLKKYLRNFIQKNEFKESISPIDILYEITKKNISMHLSDSSISNFYRQELNQSNIDKIYSKFLCGNNKEVYIDFEKNLLSCLKKIE
ncbi:GTPase era domain protein [Moumouvirus australiensis]|uniref:GTPase era domain protein n=1 Tax=Moumouvirus australiensis TaxID=2109587 RepID=A0A2P1EMA9_9VIRU|nr:GTPase era domain protein [Moumouvirus australiensis]AVL95037.1 GTPase era domain protein [Moumouvirus australiensis]